MEFNTKTRTGTFYKALGRRSLGEKRRRSMFGTQEPDAYFWGDELEKLGPKKYRIVNGGFTHLRAADAALGDLVGLDHRQSRRLRAAEELGLPGEGRTADVSAGLLLPDSGRRSRHRLPDSDLRRVDDAGPELATPSSGRSAAATTRPCSTTGCRRTGQRVGGEYRYVPGAGFAGQCALYWLNEKSGRYRDPTAWRPAPAAQLRHSRQRHPAAPGSDPRCASTSTISPASMTQQTYRQTSTTRRRTATARIGGNVAGTSGSSSLSVTCDRNRLLLQRPRLDLRQHAARARQPRGDGRSDRRRRLLSASSEYARLLRSSTWSTCKTSGSGPDPHGFRSDRADAVQPLAVSRRQPRRSAWHGTFWTESLTGPMTGQPSEGSRRSAASTSISGTASSARCSRAFRSAGRDTRHEVQARHRAAPGVQKITAIDNSTASSSSRRATTRSAARLAYTYGLTNRFHARRRPQQAREVLTVTLVADVPHQSAGASRFDRRTKPASAACCRRNFSPVRCWCGAPDRRDPGGVRPSATSRTRRC